MDAHNHTGDVERTRVMVDAARAYGVTEFWTMAPLEFVKPLREAFPGQFHFVAIPGWKRDMPVPQDDFFDDWRRRVDAFAELGSRLIKFHAAPGTCRRWGISLDDPRILGVLAACLPAGLSFHDPCGGSQGSGSSARERMATEPMARLRASSPCWSRMLEPLSGPAASGGAWAAPWRRLDLLARRLEKYPNYILDMSATKWMVRVAEQKGGSGGAGFLHCIPGSHRFRVGRGGG